MSNKFVTRQQKREIDEHRKLGVLPPQEDKEGFYINPHIPSYMADAPWYINDGPGLYHQRLETLQIKRQDMLNDETTIRKGVIKNKSKRNKWLSGSCENCGATTHQKNDCTERPRKKKAKYTKKNISKDEYLPQKRNLTWDGKRDRWNGFDVDRYQITIKKWELVEKTSKQKQQEDLRKRMEVGSAKERRKARKKLNKLTNNNLSAKLNLHSDSDSDIESDNDDNGMKDSGHVIQKFHTKTRQTVRNLRIREDLPKYLRNLDPTSAYYDPKSRAMRENPYSTGELEPHDDYLGDNLVNQSGDAVKFSIVNNFAQQVTHSHGMEKAGNMLLNSNPTSTELAFKYHDKTKGKRVKKLNEELLLKYGGQKYIKRQRDKILDKIFESYQEYQLDGRMKKTKSSKTKSKYIEDIHPNKHKTIWGSFYDLKSKNWGYACCQITIYNSVCNSGKRDGNGKISELNESKRVRQIGVISKPIDNFSGQKKKLKSGYTVVKGVVSVYKEEQPRKS